MTNEQNQAAIDEAIDQSRAAMQRACDKAQEAKDAANLPEAKIHARDAMRAAGEAIAIADRMGDDADPDDEPPAWLVELWNNEETAQAAMVEAINAADAMAG